jgi:thiol-disulfide isomerase/thioredoxin
MKTNPGIFIILLIMISCSDGSGLTQADLNKTYQSPDGSIQPLKALEGDSGTVFIFFSPDCPLCVNYTLTVTQLQQAYQKKGIGFVSVYPGTYYTVGEVEEFVNKYHPELPTILDPQLTFTKVCKATVTPEAILIDKEGNIVYRGAIDDWSFATGKKKRQADRFFLADAIEAFLSGHDPEPAATEPIGCFIE